MRALLLSAALLAGCGSDTLGEDTAYRRLVDQFSTYEQCVSAGFVGCYETLTLCQSGRVRMELDPQRMEGKYTLEDDTAVAAFPTMIVRFLPPEKGVIAFRSADGKPSWITSASPGVGQVPSVLRQRICPLLPMA